MSPSLAEDNLANVGLGNPEFWSKCRLGFARCVSASDFEDLGVGQFRERVGLSWPSHSVARPPAIAFLSNAVSDVVELRSEEHMIRTIARRVVAVVKNAHTIWNRAMLQGPGISMCQLHLSLQLKSTIPMVIKDSCPEPTAFALGHLCPEPDRDRDARCSDVPTSRISVLTPSSPMTETPATSGMRIGAMGNRATGFHAFQFSTLTAL